MKQIFWLLFLCAKFAFPALAQNYGNDTGWINIRCRKILGNAIVIIDSQYIVPGTFSVCSVPDSLYGFNYSDQILRWKSVPPKDSVTVCYRVLPSFLQKKYQHKNAALVDRSYLFGRQDINLPGGETDPEKRGGLFCSGSYARNISLGNNQDVVLNSNFNLQANGYIGDSIKVEAAITDNTIPVQPEGNSVSIQEFDQISLRLSKGGMSLLLGDYAIQRPNSYFMNFSRRVQGVYLQSESVLAGGATNRSGLSASMAKGEFARNIFAGSEGNQGPYRLTGNYGEQLFIVLAGTEKVYVDNILQERGEQADYIVNYNTNEIRFMPGRIITGNSRIQVEFEYRSNNYLNTLLYAYSDWSFGGRWNVRLDMFSNQDAKNQPFQQEISAEQKSLLAGIGDSIQKAFVPDIRPDTFGASRILYRLTDTIVNGVYYDSVLRYAQENTGQLYAASFSFVGSGNGDYVLAPVNANGRVYVWVAPEAGRQRGDYTPLLYVVTPKKQQMVTVGASWQIDSGKRVEVALAVSNYDPNLFSSKDDAKHIGLATRLSYSDARKLNRQWGMGSAITLEHVQDRFKPIAPFRQVEFGRDWNVPMAGPSPTDNWLSASTELKHQSGSLVNMTLGYYQRTSGYTGLRNALSGKLNGQRWTITGAADMLQSRDTGWSGVYLKPGAALSYRLAAAGSTFAGGSWLMERNDKRAQRTDSLMPDAFLFDISSVYLRSEHPDRNFRLSYTLRNDYLPSGTSFRHTSRSHDISLTARLLPAVSHSIIFTGTYRELLRLNMPGQNSRPEVTYLGRLEYNGSLARNAIQLGTLYEFGSGLEQRRSFTYVQVPAGQGIYNWIDYNHDSLQQLNEFVTGLYPDQKLFIRIFTPTDVYNKAYTFIWNQTVTLEPQYLSGIAAGKWLYNLLARISDQFSVQMSRKVMAGEGTRVLNPFSGNFNDTSIITESTAWNNTFYCNRAGKYWGIDYNYMRQNAVQLLSYGLTSFRNEQHLVRTRLHFSTTLTLIVVAKNSTTANRSPVSDGTSYHISGNALLPELLWQPGSNIRLSAEGRLDRRKNAAGFGGETAVSSGGGMNFRYSQLSSGMLQARFIVQHILYSGAPAAPVVYMLLDGLNPGTNYLWSFSWQRKLGKNIELSLEYDGRKPEATKLIHTGRMSLRAIL